MKNVLKIYGPIDSYGWQLYRVREFLNNNKGEVVIEINSLGGSVNDAMVISKEIADHGNVTVRLIAFCASAATWAGFGAKKIEIADDALWLCHQTSVVVDLYRSLKAEEIEKTIEDLKKTKKLAEATDLIIARKYMNKAIANGKETDLSKVLDLMKEEKYLTAQEVVDLGFADAIIKGDKNLTNGMKEYLIQNSAALNLPSLPETKEQKEENDDTSLFARVKDYVLGLFEQNNNTTAKADNNVQPKKVTMKKEFKLVLQLLGMTDFTCNETGAVLTEEQLQLIEDQLHKAKQEHDEAAAAVATLDAISENVKSIDGIKNKILAVKTLLDRTPMGSPAVPAGPVETQEEKEQKALDETAQDPVNALARGL